MWEQIGDKHQLVISRGILAVEVEPLGQPEPDGSQEYVFSVRGHSARTRYYRRFDNLSRAKLGALQECVHLLDRVRDQALAHIDVIDADLIVESLRRNE